MNIAAMSTILSQAKIQQQASTSVMKMAMNNGKTQANDMVQMLQESTKMVQKSADPNLGRNINIKA